MFIYFTTRVENGAHLKSKSWFVYSTVRLLLFFDSYLRFGCLESIVVSVLPRILHIFKPVGDQSVDVPSVATFFVVFTMTRCAYKHTILGLFPRHYFINVWIHPQ